MLIEPTKTHTSADLLGIPPDAPTSRRRVLIIALVLGTLLYIALLVAHALTRKPWNDEAMSALAGYNLAFHGHTGVSFYDEAGSGLPGVSRHSYYIFPFQLVVLSIWYHIVPFTLLATRSLAMLWLLLMLAACYNVLRRLTGDPAIALTGTVLSALDYQVMLAGSFGRYDTMVAALGFGSYALFLTLRERNLNWAVLASNTAVVMAGTTHPNGFFYFLGLWLLILYFDRSRINWRLLALAAMPYAIGALFWARFILADYPSFHAQLKQNSGGRIGLLHPIQTFLSEIQMRYITAFGLGGHSAGHNSPLVRLKALSLLAYLFGIIGCIAIPAIRKNPVYRPLFLLAFLHWFLLTFWENMKFAYYLVHLAPFYWALVAIVAVTLWRTLSTWPRAVLAGSLAAIALVQVGGILMQIRQNDYAHSYAPAVAYLKQHAAPGDLVFGSCSLGFGYGFPPQFVDDDTLGFYSGKVPEYIVLEEIYDTQQQSYQTIAPQRYAHIRKLLGLYDVVYRNSEYRVLRRR